MKLNEVAYRGPTWKDEPFRKHVLKLEQIAKDFLVGNTLVELSRDQMTSSLTGKGQTWNFTLTYKRPGIDDNISISSLYKGNDPAIKANLQKREGIASVADRFSKISRTIVGLVDRLKKEDNDILFLKHISFYAAGDDNDNQDDAVFTTLSPNGDHRKFASLVSKFDDSVSLVFASQKDIDKRNALVKEGAGHHNATTINSLTSMIRDTTRRHGILKKSHGDYGDILPDVKVTHAVASHYFQIEIIWPLMKESDKHIHAMYSGNDESIKTKLFDKLMRTRWEKVNICAVEIVRTIQTSSPIKKLLGEIGFKFSHVFYDYITRMTRYTPQNFLTTFGKRQPTLDDLDSTQTVLTLRFDLPDEEE